MTEPTYSVALNRHLETMLISAVRYALGRRTYIVGETCDYITAYLPKVSNWCLEIISRDLDDTARMAERSKDYRVWGDDCDRRDWLKLDKAVKAEIKRRTEND